jgi:peptidoglycan/LPS O-acetylase OafA/YrhL
MAALVFSSNILFWMQSGYFDTAAELKPLLHTWSLAVEEQYYLFFPLLIMLLWRAGVKAITIIIAITLVSSLAFTIWLYGKDQVGAFYLLPARAWEILAGAMIALIGWKSNSRTINNIGSIVGLILVITSVLAYKKVAKLHALYALPSVLGAVLVIQFAREGTIVQRLLGTRPFLIAGLLSYSAYLWHQPLFAFAKFRLSHDLSNPAISALILATIVLSVLTYRLIESPTRKAKGQRSRAVIAATLAFASL